MTQKPKHSSHIQIRFNDIDKMNHVNNATHLTFIETARINYFRDVVGKSVDWNETGMIIAKTIIDYKTPIQFNDDIFIYTEIIRFGNKSFDIKSDIVKRVNDTETLCSSATITMVCYNYKTQQTIAIPTDWKEKVEKYQK